MSLPVFAPILLLLALLGTGAWVALGIIGVGAGSLMMFRSVPVDRILAQSMWNGLSSPELVALPLFILMAELLFRSRFIDGLFHALEPWVRRLPGGLLHTNVLGCAFFALVSGSSAATTNAVGKITLSELPKRGYDRSIVMGSLAGAGTLGFLIPPSIIMIIYGVLSQTSVLQLFAAGILPGVLLAIAFMGYIAARSFFTSDPAAEAAQTEGGIWKERFSRLPVLFPFLILMTVLLGSMYGGLASPSEAAAIAVGCTMVIMAFERTLSARAVIDACVATARTASMLGLIIAAAAFLSTAMGYLGLPQAIAGSIQALDLSPLVLIALLLVVYIILGSFLEGMSLIVMTLPVVLPIVLNAGYDKVWFGVFLIIVVEMAQITPPVGMNLFVIQGLTGEKLAVIIRAAFPFFLIMVAFAFVIAMFPQIVTILPSML
jgi:C4-dicarboxylate transporter, DctM subunit